MRLDGKTHEKDKIQEVKKDTGGNSTEEVSYIDIWKELQSFVTEDNTHTHFEIICN